MPGSGSTFEETVKEGNDIKRKTFVLMMLVLMAAPTGKTDLFSARQTH